VQGNSVRQAARLRWDGLAIAMTLSNLHTRQCAYVKENLPPLPNVRRFGKDGASFAGTFCFPLRGGP